MRKMSAVAFDTLKIAQQFQDAGFSRKQAAGAAEILADLLAQKSDKDAVIKAIETLGISVDRRFFAVAQQLTDIRGDIAELRAGQIEMRGDITEMRGDITEIRGDITEIRGDITEIRGDITGLKTGQERLFGLLEKILEGQAVLTQNDLELRRLIESR